MHLHRQQHAALRHAVAAHHDPLTAATSGALTIGVNEVPPIPPSEEIVNVLPDMSPGVSFPSRALPDNEVSSAAISSSPFWSAPLITGTSRPPGVSAAKPML